MFQIAVTNSKRGDSSRQSIATTIPNIFCWTKMGTEAGQSLDKILHRKEIERRAGEGVFAWGVGNPLGNAPEVAKLMSPSGEVEVLFTPMKSPPKIVDIAPSKVLLWVFYQTKSGRIASLPEHILVTSRGSDTKRTHYALLCKSDNSIEKCGEYGTFDSIDVRNLVSGNPVGASQVTSVVHYFNEKKDSAKPYKVALKAKLYAEGFIKLIEPITLDEELTVIYESLCQTNTVSEWKKGVSKLKNTALATKFESMQEQELLFA